jgi:aryl-alcohol dehydrogenase-like predicted oxidoreductase
MESEEFRYRKLPVIDKRVLRLGLACNFGIDAAGVDWALGEGGMQYVFWTPRHKLATEVLRRALKRDRDRYAVATGPTTALWSGNLRRYVDKVRTTLDVDQIDVLQMFWLGKTSRWAPRIVAELESLRDEGAVRAIGISIHDRKRAAELARSSPLDLLMIRYNAAHPGAEQDVFPHLPEGRHTVVSYTATCWRYLLRRPKGWQGPMPTAGDCYRFCLSSPHVDVTLTGPANLEQLRENLMALDRGPLSVEEMAMFRELGPQVKARGYSWL